MHRLVTSSTLFADLPLLVSTLAILMVAACEAAPEPFDEVASSPPPQMEMPGGPWQLELQELSARFDPIREETLQDPAVVTARREYEAAFQAASATDTAFDAVVERYSAIMADIRDARTRGDEALAGQLQRGTAQLERELNQARGRIEAQAEVAAARTKFDTTLRQRMIDMNPAEEADIDRWLELQDRVRCEMGIARCE